MKRVLLTLLLSASIHGWLLNADFKWLKAKPQHRPAPRLIIMTLTPLPPKAVKPLPKKHKPLAPPRVARLKEPPKPAKPLPLSPPKPLEATKKVPAKKLPVKKTRPKPPVHFKKSLKTVKLPALSEPARPVPAPPQEPDTGRQRPTEPDWNDDARIDATANDDPITPQAGIRQPPMRPVVREACPMYQKNPPPRYPLSARKRGHAGTVILEVLVDKNGTVADLRIYKSSGYTVLDRAAAADVKKWLFEPGIRGDSTVDMWVRVPIRFDLR